MSAQPIDNVFQADHETRAKNARHFDGLKHDDECFLCGRGLTAKALENGYWVHLLTDDTLAPAALEWYSAPTSQGAFPVGSECAKRIPRGYKFKRN